MIRSFAVCAVVLAVAAVLMGLASANAEPVFFRVAFALGAALGLALAAMFAVARLRHGRSVDDLPQRDS